MKAYFAFSNILVAASSLLFISSFFIKSTGRSYVAAAGAEAAVVALAFAITIIALIHAGIVGLVYASKTTTSTTNIKIIASIELGIPALLLVGGLLYPLYDYLSDMYKNNHSLDYAIKTKNLDLIRKITSDPDRPSDLHASTLKFALRNGLEQEALDILINKHYEGSLSFEDMSNFQKACLEGLITGNRNDLWPFYLETFKALSPGINYDDFVFDIGVRYRNQSVVEFFSQNPEQYHWSMEKSIEANSAPYLQHLMKLNIPVIHSKHHDLLDYAINNDSSYHKEFTKFILRNIYKYDAAMDNKKEKLLLRMKSPEVLNWLIQNGASIFQTDNEENSFYLNAITKKIDIYGARDIYKEYKESGYLYTQNKQGLTIHMALAENDPGEFFWAYNDVKIDTLDKQNNHILHYLFRSIITNKLSYSNQSDLEPIKRIIADYKKHNMDINAANIHGVMPLQYAIFDDSLYDKLLTLGFTINNINQVTMEPALVDAYKDYITAHIDSTHPHDIDYIERTVKKQLQILPASQRLDSTRKIQEFIKHLLHQRNDFDDCQIEVLNNQLTMLAGIAS